MQECIDLAKKGQGYVSPNPLVGSVIVKDDVILSRGYHKRFGSLHAEASAIANAKTDLKGATLYVNLEPCCHYGKQPPCTQAIINAGISRVVIGIRDPNPLMQGKGITLLKEANISVTEGILKNECEQINESYIYFTKYTMPFTIYKYATTIDGVQAFFGKTHDPDTRHLTCPESDRYVHQLRHAVDAILIGANTVRSDNPSLTDRSGVEPVSHPLRIVIGSQAKTLFDSKILATAEGIPTLFATTEPPSKDTIYLESRGVDVLHFEGNKVSCDLLLKELAKRKIQSLLIEGGEKTIQGFFEEKLIQKIEIFITPNLSTQFNSSSLTTKKSAIYYLQYAKHHFLKKSGKDLHITAYC